MTGPEHYREAEKLTTAGMANTDNSTSRVFIAAAQVHAMLALAAAFALNADEALPDAWYEVLDAETAR